MIFKVLKIFRCLGAEHLKTSVILFADAVFLQALFIETILKTISSTFYISHLPTHGRSWVQGVRVLLWRGGGYCHTAAIPPLMAAHGCKRSVYYCGGGGGGTVTRRPSHCSWVQGVRVLPFLCVSSTPKTSTIRITINSYRYLWLQFLRYAMFKMSRLTNLKWESENDSRQPGDLL